MFKIDKSENFRISMTRGDSGTINLKTQVDYFMAGDIITFLVTAEGDYTEMKLKKETTVPVGASMREFSLELGPEDTKSICPAFGGCAKTFWYEISCSNSTRTIVHTLLGADEFGPKELVLYPEGNAGENI